MNKQESYGVFKSINTEYKKPLLTIISISLLIVVFSVCLFLAAVIAVVVLFYVTIAYWIDLVIGKYLIKGILKL
jgi:hypothetical protein